MRWSVGFVVGLAMASSCRFDEPPDVPERSAAPPRTDVADEEPPEPIATPIEVAPPEPAPATARQPAEGPWTEEDWPRIQAVQPIIRAAAAEHGIDPHLVNGIIWHESKFHRDARGAGGAAGLMQLMPGTSRALARKLGRPHRPFQVEFNVEVGTYLLARLLEKFHGNERLALAGYGLGSGRVRALQKAGKPLPARTERFIAKVQRVRRAFAKADAREAEAEAEVEAQVRSSTQNAYRY
jgi:soluble lytic murein transglycosylase-like protein